MRLGEPAHQGQHVDVEPAEPVDGAVIEGGGLGRPGERVAVFVGLGTDGGLLGECHGRHSRGAGRRPAAAALRVVAALRPDCDQAATTVVETAAMITAQHTHVDLPGRL
jgi:hypothetical protein